MRKVVIHKAGDYQQLKLEECDSLVHEYQDVIVSVKAFGINYADVVIRWGLYASAKQFVGWPITPGFEFSGIVKSVAPGVEKFKVGDAVLGVTLFNAYASEVRVPERQLFSIPEGLGFEAAAGIPAVFMTAYHALYQNIVIRSGMTALIHSAAGGVGSALVQMCAIAGIRTIGVVGASHKISSLERLGCDVIIDKSKDDLWARVEEISPSGVDIIFDANGGRSFKDSYAHLAPCGKLVAYGAHSMFPSIGGKVNWPKLVIDYFKTPRFNPLEMTSANKSLITFNLSFLFNRQELLDEAMERILEWLSEGKLAAPPIRTYRLDQIGVAHRDLESGQTVGKLVVTPDTY